MRSDDKSGIEAQAGGKRCGKPLRRRDAGATRRSRIGDQRAIAPKRRAIHPPIHADGPSRQRLARIPLALAGVQESTGRKRIREAAQKRFGKLALLRRRCRVVPLRSIHVVDRNERRLAALCQAHVVLREVRVDAPSKLTDRFPLRVAVRFCDSRILVDARDAHRKRELHRARIGEADHRCRVARIGSAGKRQVPLAGEEAGRRVEPDPAGAWQKGFRPGMQVRELPIRARGAVERLHVGDKLNQVARREACGDAELAQYLHEQPTRVAAGTATSLQRVVGRLHARLHPHEVLDLELELLVETHQRVDGLFSRRNRLAKTFEPRGKPRSKRRNLEERDQLLRERGCVAERIVLGVGLDEKVERIGHGHVRREVDDDVQRRGGFGEHKPRDPVPVRILLPIEEIFVRSDLQRIAENRRPAMRRRA